MSITRNLGPGLGAALGSDQATKVMQQQIAELERQLAHVTESLDAMAQLSQALSASLSAQGKRVPSMQKVMTGPNTFKLVLRP